ncbi:SDR family NAD(P)-dependent oxidoreductase [Vibrio ostreicida]|uniref:SDR family NAD(P)-dependent oxidoreductase n=1 Tax=Vibrio ostreicida TaxID=526588 RepID=UPI0009702F7B|nr:SDR family NAD(P)-dependent oxidoreductase [Vibrio ostreicida]
MANTILITGATDGIGYETAKKLRGLGHRIIVHGRNPDKLEKVITELKASGSDQNVEGILADLSELNNVKSMAEDIARRVGKLDIIINNAGVYTTSQPTNSQGLDVRFVVNTLAPYLLTKQLLPILSASGRVINLSSAAQAPVSLDALKGQATLSDSAAYAQSKLALTMWSQYLGLKHKTMGPVIVSVNPKSLLGSKMVQEAYGITGGDLKLGAEILVRATLNEDFSQAHGAYFDNDIEAFASPHPAAADQHAMSQLIAAMESILSCQ